MKVDILAIGVHPDDVELSCAGTLLSHIDQGKTVGLLDLTRGELGSRGSAEIRDEEAATSAKMMGAKFRKNLRMADGFFEYTKENMLDIIRVIRESQPEIILINAPTDRHPDHGRAAKLCADACFYSGLIKIETLDAFGNLQDKWRPKAVYHYIQDRSLKPDFIVDIGPYIDRKEELILAFKSQFYVPDAEEYSEEVQTPISGKSFLAHLRGRAASAGRDAGFDYAEGYVAARTIGVKSLFDLV